MKFGRVLRCMCVLRSIPCDVVQHKGVSRVMHHLISAIGVHSNIHVLCCGAISLCTWGLFAAVSTSGLHTCVGAACHLRRWAELNIHASEG
jgi:hypothetical protein